MQTEPSVTARTLLIDSQQEVMEASASGINSVVCSKLHTCFIPVFSRCIVSQVGVVPSRKGDIDKLVHHDLVHRVWPVPTQTSDGHKMTKIPSNH